MAENFSVEAYLKATDKGFTSTFKAAVQSVKDLDKQTAGFTEGFSSMMKTVGKVAITGAAAFATFGIKSASEISAMNAQFEQVFGDMEGIAEDAVDGMAKEFGILPNRLKPMFSQTTSKFKGLGLDVEDAMKQATIATTLAADGAAFYDKSLEDVTSGLNSFINGSYEGGEAIGLFANETQLAEWASNNLGAEWENLDEAGKQVIRLKYAEAMYGMAGATGQAARESMTLENQMGNVLSAFGNLSAAVMEPIMGPLIEGLAEAAGYLNDAAEDVRNLNAYFVEHQDVIKATASVITAFITSLILYNTWLFLTGVHTVIVAGATVQMTGAMLIATNATALFGAVMAFITSPITLVVMAIGLLIAAYILITANSEYLLQKMDELGFNMETVNAIVAKSQAVFAQAQVIFASVAEYLKKLAGNATEAGIGLYDSFIAYLPTIIGYLQTFWGVAKQAFGFLLQIIQPTIDKFTSMYEAIKTAFSTGNFDGLIEVAKFLIPMIIGFFLAGIPKMILMGYNILNAVAKGMGISVPELLIQIIEIITNIITTFISYLPMILQIGVDLLLAIVNGIITALPLIMGGIYLVLSFLIESIATYLPMILTAGVNILTALIQGIVSFIPQLITTAISLITFLAETFLGLLPILIMAGIEILMALIDGIAQVLPSLIGAGIEIIVSLAGAFIQMLPIIIAAGIELLMALIKGILTILPQLIAMGIDLIIQVAAAFISMLPQIIAAGVEILMALIDGLIKTIPALVNALPEIFIAIIDAFEEVEWLDIGVNIIKGIASGIGQAAGSLWEAAKSVLGGFKDNVLSFFGIHSPSLWGKNMVGINLTKGIGVGISKGAGALIRTAVGMSNSLANAITTPTVDIAGSVARTNGSINTAVSHTFENMLNKQPAQVSLNLGGRSYTAFVDDISGRQNQVLKLEETYLGG